MIGTDIEDLVDNYRNVNEGIKLNQISIISIRNSLLTWYSDNKRKLPWRGDKVGDNGEPFDDIMETLSFPNAYGTWVRCVIACINLFCTLVHDVHVNMSLHLSFFDI
jgi:hypothetical protein